jgi:creatinine amidohydrolase
VFTPQWTGDLHAGHSETSLMLTIHPDLVRTHRLAVGNTGLLPDLWPALRSGGVRAVSQTGVLGDPTTASAAAGAVLLDRLVDDLVAAVEAWSAEPADVLR